MAISRLISGDSQISHERNSFRARGRYAAESLDQLLHVRAQHRRRQNRRESGAVFDRQSRQEPREIGWCAAAVLREGCVKRALYEMAALLEEVNVDEIALFLSPNQRSGETSKLYRARIPSSRQPSIKNSQKGRRRPRRRPRSGKADATSTGVTKCQTSMSRASRGILPNDRRQL